MKWLVLILALLNAALLGYFKLIAVPYVTPESVAGHEPIHPEQIKILTPEELSTLPKKDQPAAPAPGPVTPTPSASAAPVTTSCYEWGIFAEPAAVRAKAVLDKLGLLAMPKQQLPQEAVRYWVYIAPKHSMEEAQAKVNELKALGIEDSYIVQEPLWRYAISLGVFKDEALANKFLEELRVRGVHTAVKGRRNHENGQTSFTIKNVSLEQAGEFGKLQPEFPGSEFKQIACE